MDMNKIKEKYPNVSITPNSSKDFKGTLRTSEVNKDAEYFEMFINRQGIPFFRVFTEYCGEKIYTDPEAHIIGKFEEKGHFVLFDNWKGAFKEFSNSEKLISDIQKRFE